MNNYIYPITTGVGADYLMAVANKNTSVTNTQNGSSVSFSSVLSNAKSSEQKTTLTDIFNEASAKYDVPVNLLMAVAKVESNFSTSANSRVGAGGVMQLMPATAKGLGVSDVYNPRENILGGAKYLSQMLSYYDGDVSLALAAYNAGAGNVDKYGGVPPFKETKAYVELVTKAYNSDISVPADKDNITIKDSSSSIVAEESKKTSTPVVTKKNTENTQKTSENTAVPVTNDIQNYVDMSALNNDDVYNILFYGSEDEFTYDQYKAFLDMYLNTIRQAYDIGIDNSSSSSIFGLGF